MSNTSIQHGSVESSSNDSDVIVFHWIERIVLYFPAQYTKRHHWLVNVVAISMSAVYILNHFWNDASASYYVSSYLPFASRVFTVILVAIPHLLSIMRMVYFAKHFDMSILRRSIHYPTKIRNSMEKFVRVMSISITSYYILLTSVGVFIVLWFSSFVCYTCYKNTHQ